MKGRESALGQWPGAEHAGMLCDICIMRARSDSAYRTPQAMPALVGLLVCAGSRYAPIMRAYLPSLSHRCIHGRIITFGDILYLCTPKGVELGISFKRFLYAVSMV